VTLRCLWEGPRHTWGRAYRYTIFSAFTPTLRDSLARIHGQVIERGEKKTFIDYSDDTVRGDDAGYR